MLCTAALDLVHEQGYHSGIVDEFLKRTERICTIDQRSIRFQEKIKMVLQQEGQKVPEASHYLGSSEIIESLFGKFKAIEGDHASSGLTSLVLAIPALVGTLNEAIVAEALETVSLRDIDQWNEENMGKTFLSRRRCALNIHHEDDAELELDLDICD